MRRNKLKILWFVFQTLLRLNFFKTIYFNFKVLPFKEAVKLPFHFYGETKFVNLSGKFKILSAERHFGMIVFGGTHEIVIFADVPTRIYNSGTIEFAANATFARGINVLVWDHGHLSIGENFSIGSLSRIIVFRKMAFGANVLISWECQFFDTDFHFIVSENQVGDNCAAVSIEDDVWIGARATVLKGSEIRKESIVAANAVCSRSYAESGLLAGIPARMSKHGIRYIKNKQKESELFRHFAKNPNTVIDWNL